MEERARWRYKKEECVDVECAERERSGRDLYGVDQVRKKWKREQSEEVKSKSVCRGGVGLRERERNGLKGVDEEINK